MNETRIENNKVTLSGEIVSDFNFNHKVFGERFYSVALEVKRLSEKNDIMQIMVSERLVDVKTDWTGRFAKVSGQFRSYNKHDGIKNWSSIDCDRHLVKLGKIWVLHCKTQENWL